MVDTRLREARLHHAQIERADLRDADLAGAYLSSADLAGADLKLAGAAFRDTRIDMADLREVVFRPLGWKDYEGLEKALARAGIREGIRDGMLWRFLDRFAEDLGAQLAGMEGDDVWVDDLGKAWLSQAYWVEAVAPKTAPERQAHLRRLADFLLDEVCGLGPTDDLGREVRSPALSGLIRHRLIEFGKRNNPLARAVLARIKGKDPCLSEIERDEELVKALLRKAAGEAAR